MNGLFLAVAIKNLAVIALSGFLVVTLIDNELAWGWGLVPLLFIGSLKSDD